MGYNPIYKISIQFIPSIFHMEPNLANKCNEDYLQQFSLKAYNYNLIIARMEPENSIKTILQGFVNSKSEEKIDCYW